LPYTTDANLLSPWPARDRDDFLRGLWSFWLLVGIATRRVRKTAWTEKTTVILKHLWEHRHLFTERRFDESPAGYRPAHQTLWLPRGGVRKMLHLPKEQFPDDDAVNVFYRGQAFYDRTTNAVADRQIWEQVAAWRIARRLRLPMGLPSELLYFVRDTLGLDIAALPYPGVYFNGYDDALIWIGCTFDDVITSELPITHPVERVRVLQEELVLPGSDRRVIEPVLRSTLHLAINPVPYRDVVALLTHAMDFQQMPASLVPEALRYLLFVQTQGIPQHGGLILRLLEERWSLVKDVFAAQAYRDVRVAQRALVPFMTLISDRVLAEAILQDLHYLLDPETILALLPNVRDASIFNGLANTLREHPSTNESHLVLLEHALHFQNITASSPE
jgi:hypothetical protein